MKWLVTGAAGFIGTNLCKYLTEQGATVVAIDDFSRDGVLSNAAFLNSIGVQVDKVDVSDKVALEAYLSDSRFDSIAHLAGQVSLLQSITDPRRDFEINVLGTLNVLEYVRLKSPDASLIGMSSNKIYGDLQSVEILEQDVRYSAPNFPNGFDESLPLSFHGPTVVQRAPPISTWPITQESSGLRARAFDNRPYTARFSIHEQIKGGSLS